MKKIIINQLKNGTRYAMDENGIPRSYVVAGDQLQSIVKCGNIVCSEYQGQPGETQELIEAVVLSPVGVLLSPDTGTLYSGTTLPIDYPGLLGRCDDQTFHLTNEPEIVDVINMVIRLDQEVFDLLAADDRYFITEHQAITVEVPDNGETDND